MGNEFKISAIGQVCVSEDGFSLELAEAFIPALKGLDGFSTLNVLWWSSLFDSEEARAILTCEQPYKNAPDEMGIFATRSPVRPNPILLTAVSVLHIDYDKGKIYIPFIDAEDGTPILDIKPYHPSTDRVREVSVPDWCKDWPEWVEDSATFDWEGVFENA